VRNGTLQNGTFQKWYFPKMVLFNFEMYRYPTEVLVNFLLPAIFFPLPLSLSLIEFFIDRYIYIYIYNIYAYDTDILRKTLQKREGGGRSRKSTGSKKLTKNSVRNGTFQNVM
jgi:hypothetical protein